MSSATNTPILKHTPNVPGELSISKIERIDLRQVWPHEAHHFTSWLADNLDVISGVVGLDLTLVEREAPAGSFSVDLLAEDDENRTVVIENQLGKSDHDHLGKLMTYLAAYEAHGAIWIVGEPRPEHAKAIAWLNDSSPANFYLLRAEAVRIDQSPAALLLTPIVGPSEESKVVAKEKQEKSERHELRRRFWTELLELSATKTKLHSGVSAGDQNWLGQSAGKTGLSFNYVARQKDWRVELYIDTGDANRNEAILASLSSKRPEIEDIYGEKLDWQALEGRRACRISSPWADGGYRTDVAHWPEVHESMIDAMIRLDCSLRPHLATLP